MKKIKTAELIGAALDWAVAQCELMRDDYVDRGLLVHRVGYGQPMPPYSTDWSQGGPIIDREAIQLMNDPVCTRGKHQAIIRRPPFLTGYGDTKRVAAMRCYIMHKLGTEVEVPDEIA